LREGLNSSSKSCREIDWGIIRGTTGIHSASPAQTTMNSNLTIQLLTFNIIGSVSLSLSACNSEKEGDTVQGPGADWDAEELGRELFFDTNLSARRTQACSTCHDPSRGFTDGRLDGEGNVRSGSLGDDGESIGDRNAPSAAYAAFSPELTMGERERFNTDGDLSDFEGYLGGLFHDGRADTLEDQAGGPPLAAGEMGMPNEEAVVERLLENASYENAFRALYGTDVFDSADNAYAAMTSAIAAFERTDEVSPFNSRYDRSLLPVGEENRYVYNPASRAAQGKALFFSTEFTNCSACHQLHAQTSADATREVFTGFEYHNIGVPENAALRLLSGGETDLGLGALLGDETADGKFKTPTLRNVAITSPYMHNGVFTDLETVIAFYGHQRLLSSGQEDASTNPETQEAWRAPEVDRNLSALELANGNKDLLDPENIEALVCFLLSLTDEGNEEGLDPAQVQACGL